MSREANRLDPPRLDILILASEAAGSASFVTALAPFGHRLRITESAKAAIRSVLERRPDVQVISSPVPPREGVEAVWYSRMLELGDQPLPVIAIVARSDRVGHQSLLAAGADSVLPMPADPNSLHRLLIDLWAEIAYRGLKETRSRRRTMPWGKPQSAHCWIFRGH